MHCFSRCFLSRGASCGWEAGSPGNGTRTATNAAMPVLCSGRSAVLPLFLSARHGRRNTMALELRLGRRNVGEHAWHKYAAKPMRLSTSRVLGRNMRRSLCDSPRQEHSGPQCNGSGMMLEQAQAVATKHGAAQISHSLQGVQGMADDIASMRWGRSRSVNSRRLLYSERPSARLTRGLSRLAGGFGSASCRYIPRYLIARTSNAS